jgi:hypothetical protein
MGKYVPPHHKHAQRRADEQALAPEAPALQWEDIPDMSTLRWCDLVEDEMEKEPPVQEEGEWVTIKKKKKHRWKR